MGGKKQTGIGREGRKFDSAGSNVDETKTNSGWESKLRTQHREATVCLRHEQ